MLTGPMTWLMRGHEEALPRRAEEFGRGCRALYWRSRKRPRAKAAARAAAHLPPQFPPRQHGEVREAYANSSLMALIPWMASRAAFRGAGVPYTVRAVVLAVLLW